MGSWSTRETLTVVEAMQELAEVKGDACKTQGQSRLGEEWYQILKIIGAIIPLTLLKHTSVAWIDQSSKNVDIRVFIFCKTLEIK